MKYVFKTKPYKHQVKALKRALKTDHLGVLWEPGMGKTKFIIDWACAMAQLGRIQRMMVVCPLSVTGVWAEEFEIHAPEPYVVYQLDKRDTTVGQRCPMCGSAARQQYKWKPDMEPVKYRHRCHDCDFDSGWVKLVVLVVNYDRAWRRDTVIRDFKPEFIVADESHRIKKASTKRSFFMRSFNKAPYRAILTGTPTPRSFLDLYGQWVFLAPKTFGTRVKDFKERYLIFGGFKGYEIRGYRYVDELKTKVKSDATIRRKDQALDLPDKIYQRVPVLLEPEARRQYETLAEEFFLELSRGEIVDVKNAVVKILRLQQITGGWINTDQGLRQISTAKIDALRDLLEDRWAQQQKVVIFARFRPEVSAIVEAGRKVGYKHVYELTGSTPKAQRDSDRRAFQSSKKPALFVAQIQTGGLGITLHSAHEAIFYSVTHALDEYIQACDRLHRIGQTNKVTYRHLVAVASIDVQIYASLRAKENVMKVIMGDPSLLTRSS